MEQEPGKPRFIENIMTDLNSDVRKAKETEVLKKRTSVAAGELNESNNLFNDFVVNNSYDDINLQWEMNEKENINTFPENVTQNGICIIDTSISAEKLCLPEENNCMVVQKDLELYDNNSVISESLYLDSSEALEVTLRYDDYLNLEDLTAPAEKVSAFEDNSVIALDCAGDDSGSKPDFQHKPRPSVLSYFDPLYLANSPNKTAISESQDRSYLELVDEQLLLCFGNELGDVKADEDLTVAVKLSDIDSLDKDKPAVTNQSESENSFKKICDEEFTQLDSEIKERTFIQRECSDPTIEYLTTELVEENQPSETSDTIQFAERWLWDIVDKAVSSVHCQSVENSTDQVPIEVSDTLASEKVLNSTASGSRAIPRDQVPKHLARAVLTKAMADVSDKLALQEEENAELKLQLNASQQVRASLELQLRQKEEVIIKSQAESLRKDQAYKQEIKQLKEKLDEKCVEYDNTQVKDLQETNKSLKSREAKLLSELNARKNDEQNYRKIMDEYEKTIGTQLSELQKLNEEHETVKRHLANLELAFSDVHQKYERSKKIIDGYKCNEDALRQTLVTSEDSVIKSEEKYESLKAHAKAQIEKSNQEMQLMRDQYESEIHKLSAVIRRLEIKNASLADSLDQKKKECSALAALCDEVTGKV